LTVVYRLNFITLSSSQAGRRPGFRPVADGYWTTRGYANSRIANSRTGRLADWTSRGLVNSRTRQLAYWTSRGLDNSRMLSATFWA